MEADFCVVALEEALARYGTPEIFNTDQGAQFTSFAFTTTLRDAEVRISMDGRGRWMDNVFIERLWRSLKYGSAVFLNAFETGGAARDWDRPVARLLQSAKTPLGCCVIFIDYGPAYACLWRLLLISGSKVRALVRPPSKSMTYQNSPFERRRLKRFFNRCFPMRSLTEM